VNAIRALCVAAALTVLGQGAEGVALVKALNAELLASRSATQTLDQVPFSEVYEVYQRALLP
jgi:hypothetical protein